MNEIPREINGVPLFTKAGTLRKKYSVADRLAIAGATERHLETFIEWLCPYAKQYAITKAGSDDPQAWLTVKRQPSRKDILRHLLGDAIPGVKPLWVAPWAGEFTRWLGLDIDHQGDQADFEQRVAIAARAMTTLGYEDDDLLWSPTPSGGLHVRGFLTTTNFTYQLQHLFECLGIVHTPGQLEIYPREGHGLRLPFGKIPGKPFDPSAWVRFAKALDRSEGIYRMEWREMWERAETYAWTRPEGLMRPDPAPAPAAPVPLDPFASGAQAEPCTTEVGQHLPIATEKITCPADAEAIYERGIHREGMRVAATNQLAWHFLHAKGKSVEETIELLTSWSCETGRTTSKDVQRDLANGDTKVAEQVAEIVRSIAKLPRTVGARPAPGIYQEEILWIAQGLNTLSKPSKEFRREVAFACNILIFAKGYGEKTEWSWEAPISAGGVMRKWRRFTGTRYLAPLQGLQKAGLLTLVKEKIQTFNKTGRPCTWGLRVPPRMDANAKAKGEVPMDIDEAVDYAMRIWQRAADAEAERQRLDGLR